MCTLDAAEDFDLDFSVSPARALAKIARFARTHDGIRAHVTRNGRVLLADSMGSLRIVKTMRAACEWLGY